MNPSKHYNLLSSKWIHPNIKIFWQQMNPVVYSNPLLRKWIHFHIQIFCQVMISLSIQVVCEVNEFIYLLKSFVKWKNPYSYPKLKPNKWIQFYIHIVCEVNESIYLFKSIFKHLKRACTQCFQIRNNDN